jgi:hypothetical protein
VRALVEDGASTRRVWIADLLPDELDDRSAGMIGQGMAAMKRTPQSGA